jgi:hypothetical protein
VTVAEVLALNTWIEEGDSPAEIERRAKAVKARLFDGVSDAECEEIERVIAEAHAQKAQSDGDAIDEVLRKVRGEVPAQPTPTPERKRRARLYDPQRFSRATREEGIRTEIDAVNAEARGTPLFDVEKPAERRAAASPSKTPSVSERLSKLRKR